MLNLSPETLAELEKTNPDLVAKYRAKMAGTNNAVSSARDMQDYGSVANVIGKAATDYTNADAKNVVLHNRMQDLGKSPTVVADQRSEFNPSTINDATSRNLARATEDRSQSQNDFMTIEKLRDMGQARSDADLKRNDDRLERERHARSNDPNSAESKAAREYLRVVGGVEAAGIGNFDQLTEAQAYKIAPGIMHRQDLKDKAAARREEMAQRSADRASMAAIAADSRRDAKDEKEALYQAGIRVDDAGIKEGFRPTAKDADTAKKAKAARDGIVNALNQLDALYRESGTDFVGDNAARKGALEQQILMHQKELDNLGVLQGRDEVLIRQAIPDSTGFWENVKGMFGQDRYDARSKQYRENVERQYDSTLGARGYQRTPAEEKNNVSGKPSWAK